MIDIYAMHFNQNGSVVEEKTLLQTIPAAHEGDIKLVNPKVSTKAGNAESFDFSVQPGTQYYDAFIQMRTYMYVEYDGELIFYGRVLTIEQGFYGEQKIKCEGAQAFFNDSYFPGSSEKDRDDITIGTYIGNILTNHNTQLNDPLRAVYPGEVPGNYTSATAPEQRIENVSRKFGENSWRQTKSALDDLTSHYSGMFRIRHGSDNKLYLDWYKHYYRASVIDQVVEVGVNMIDCSSITEVNNIFTVVVPIGKGSSSEERLYIDGTYFPVSRVTEFYTKAELDSGYHLKSDYLEAESRYGRIIKPQEFNTAETKEELLNECAKWVKENYQGGVEEFTVSAVDLRQLGEDVQKIMCGDRVKIRYPIGNGQKSERTLTCTSATYELYNPESNSYSFGIPASSLSKGYSVNSSKSDQDAETQEATAPSWGSSTVDTRTPYEKWWDETKTWLAKRQVWYKSNNYEPGGPNSTREMNMFWHYNNINGQKVVDIWVPIIDGVREYQSGGRTVKVYEWSLLNGKPRGNWARISREDFNARKYSWTDHYLMQYVYDEWKDKNTHQGPDLTDGSVLTNAMPDTIIDDPTSLITSYTQMSFVDPETGEIRKDWLKDMDFSKVIEQGKESVKGAFDNFIGLFGSGFNITSLGDGLANIAGKLTTAYTATREKISMVFGDIVDLPSGGVFGNILNVLKEDPTSHVETVISNLDAHTGNFFSIGGLTTDGDCEAGGDVTADGDVSAGGTVSSDTGITTTGYISASGEISTSTGITSDGDIMFRTTTGALVSSRDMKAIQIQQTTRENSFGSIVTKYFGSEDPAQAAIVTQEFTQSIENYLGGGDMVIARVDGDKVFLGSENADEVVVRAMNHMADVVGDVEYVEDPVTHKKHWKIMTGTGLEIDKDGTTYGVYDEGNLTGGVMVKKINGNQTETHIIGDKILVGDKSGSYYAGYISNDHYHFYSDSAKTQEITRQANKFYGDIPGDKVYTWNGTIFVETSKTLDLQTSNMKGLIGTRATVGELNAVKVRTSNLEADLVNADKIDARIASLSVIHGHALELDGFGGTSYIMSQYYYKGKPGYAKVMDSIIRNIKVVSAGTNKYKIQYQTYDDTDEVWHDASGTFDRASLLKGSWSGGIFTVSEDSNGTMAPISSTALKLENNGSVTKSGKKVTQNVKVRWFDASLQPSTQNPYQDTGFDANVTIDATSVWNDGNTSGWNDGYDNAAGTVKVDGVPTVNTSHPLSFGQSMNVVVPYTSSSGGTQTRTTLTHTFTAPSAGTISATGATQNSTKSGLASALGCNEGQLSQIFGSYTLKTSGYYGFKVTCSGSSNKYFYFYIS